MESLMEEVWIRNLKSHPVQYNSTYVYTMYTRRANISKF